MSVQGSLAATLASRVYLALLALVMLPVYLHRLGPEAYGLIALFMVLQVWFQLLDVGLTPTLARETARHRAGALSAADLRQLLRALEGLFGLLALAAGAALFLGAGFVAAHWLNVEQLPPNEVVLCVQLMALCMALRLLGELYRGVITGFERFAWLAGTQAAFGTLRMVAVLPFMAWAGGSPTHFFGFQLLAIAAETALLMAQAYRLAPRAGLASPRWSLAPVRGVLSFSLAMSMASVVWVTLSQVDKLLLSGLLSLADYGAFSLAAVAASAVLLVSGSLAEVLMPRLTQLQAQGSGQAVQALYSRATQWAGMAAWSLACVLAVFAERVLWVWTGDAALAAKAGPVLGLYALGNAALAVGAFPFYLQFAQGRLRLHLVGTALMVGVLLPAMVWATARSGAAGAAGVWLGVNVLYLLLWTPVAHARFLPGGHFRWMTRDVLPIAAMAALMAWACQVLPWPAGRVAGGCMLLGAGTLVLLASAAGSSWARSVWRRPSVVGA
jgi:O-antigen/teichoic acid export membrane protein